jgi:very-short-patch-repair endonuclease
MFEAVDPPPATEILGVQQGVLSLRQTIPGISRSAVHRHLRAGRWQRPWAGVVVTHNGPLTPQQRLWAALLGCPPRAALGGWSALAFDGMPDGLTSPPRVLLPPGARRPSMPGVIFEYSSQLGAEDVHPGAHPRRTRPARSLIDAAARATSPARARLVLVRGVQEGLVTPGQLEAALHTRGQCRHLGLLRETVTDLEGGLRSIPEAEFARLLLKRGLPLPEHQHFLQRPDGRFYLDAAWPTRLLGVEVEGSHHRLADQREHDWVRHNRATVAGWRLLHISAYEIRHEPETVAGLLREALSLQGAA